MRERLEPVALNLIRYQSGASAEVPIGSSINAHKRSELAVAVAGVKKMPLNKDWTIEDLAELRLALEFRRAPAEIATSLGRDERDVETKINELGLEKRGQEKVLTI